MKSHRLPACSSLVFLAPVSFRPCGWISAALMTSPWRKVLRAIFTSCKRVSSVLLRWSPRRSPDAQAGPQLRWPWRLILCGLTALWLLQNCAAAPAQNADASATGGTNIIRIGVLSKLVEPGKDTSQGLYLRILREAGMQARAVSAESAIIRWWWTPPAGWSAAPSRPAKKLTGVRCFPTQ